MLVLGIVHVHGEIIEQRHLVGGGLEVVADVVGEHDVEDVELEQRAYYWLLGFLACLDEDLVAEDGHEFGGDGIYFGVGDWRQQVVDRICLGSVLV